MHAAWDGSRLPGGVPAPDPRLPEAGWRVLGGAAAANATAAEWDRHRLVLGLPDGSRDMEAEKTVLLEAGFDELHGVSWDKGCYMGQELTARTKYRGLIKRRLMPVRGRGAAARAGHAGAAGRRRSARCGPDAAIAASRCCGSDALERPLACGEAVLRRRVPGLDAAAPAGVASGVRRY